MTGVRHLIFLPAAGWRWSADMSAPLLLIRVGLMSCSSSQAAVLFHRARNATIASATTSGARQVMTRASEKLQASGSPAALHAARMLPGRLVPAGLRYIHRDLVGIGEPGSEHRSARRVLSHAHDQVQPVGVGRGRPAPQPRRDQTADAVAGDHDHRGRLDALNPGRPGHLSALPATLVAAARQAAGTARTQVSLSR
jgi:hypothetical protein